MKKITKKKKVLLNYLIDNTITRYDYTSKMKEYDEEINRLNKDEEKLRKKLKPDKVDTKAVYDKMNIIITSINNVWDKLSTAEKAEFINLFVKEIRVINYTDNETRNGEYEIDIDWY